MSEFRNRSEPNFDKALKQLFFRWLLAAFAIVAAAAIFNAWPSNFAYAADVFIDEGEGDFEKPTPVETPADTGVMQSSGNDGSDSGVGLGFDADFNASKSGSSDSDTPTVIDTTTANMGSTAVEPSLQGAPIAPADKEKAKTEKPVAKKSVKPAKTAKAKAVKATKSKKAVAKVEKAKNKAAGKSVKKARKVASIKYAGGQYVTTSRDCAMESAPGAGDVIGQTKAKRKLWVEESGDTGYWKVYSRSGQAAFLSRSCF
jgi:hypothetical protein